VKLSLRLFAAREVLVQVGSLQGGPPKGMRPHGVPEPQKEPTSIGTYTYGKAFSFYFLTWERGEAYKNRRISALA
jgi:hypothetical protein